MTVSAANVDVVITNLNYARFLSAAIDSALRNAVARVIVVDDGSGDESQSVIEAYGENVTAIYKTTGGQASAFNVGFAQSRADVVIFLDADDRLFPTAAEQLSDALAADDRATRAHARMAVIDEGGDLAGAWKPPLDTSVPQGELWREPIPLLDRPWLPTSGNAFPRRLLQEIFPVPEEEFRNSADYYVVHMAAALGRTMAVEEPLSAYRVHGRNGHEPKATLDLDHVRRSVRFTMSAETHLRRLAREKARPCAALLRPSVSGLAMRLISLRLEPIRHPIPDDTRLRIALAGVGGSLRRPDLPWAARIAFASWFVVAASAPTSAVRAIAELLLDADRRGRVRRRFGWSPRADRSSSGSR